MIDKRRKIYVYRTVAEKGLGHLKIGDTQNRGGEAGVRKRISEQLGTGHSSPEYELLDWWYAEINDKRLHQHPLLAECRVHQRREWFKCDLKLVKSCYHEIVYGSLRSDSFRMRPEQEECRDKMVAWFQNGGEKFLVNAKMRFGKTFTVFQAAKMLGFRKILVLSWKTVFESWESTLNNHVDFEGWEGTFAKDGPIPTDNRPRVVWSSVQQLIHKTGRAKSSWIDREKWDLVILDEEHYGTDTEITQRRLKKISRQHTVSLSGTPYKTLAANIFEEEEIFTWSYIDEQTKRQAEEKSGWATCTYRDLPPMGLHTFHIHPDVVAQSRKQGFVDENAFCIGKLFATKDAGGFENPMLVQMFLDSLSKRSPHSVWSPWHCKAPNVESLLDHVLMVLPSDIEAVNSFCKMLQKHPFFASYQIINVAGSNNVRDIRKVKEAVRRHDKTITVTAGRFTVGVTVPEWGAVFMLEGGKSPAAYMQAIFRAQSPWRDGDTLKKENCLVFDFNPQRLFEVIYDYCETLTRPDEHTKQNIERLFECASIMEHGQNKTTPVKVEDILKAAIFSQSYITKFGSARLINKTKADINTITALADLEKKKEKKLISVLADSGLETGAIRKVGSIGRTKRQVNELEKILKETQAKAQAALSRLPTYLYISDSNEKTCREIAQCNSELFAATTGITAQVFESLLLTGFVRENMVNRCIVDFNEQIDLISFDNFMAYGE